MEVIRNAINQLINYKIHPELTWIEDCILSSAGNSAKFKVTDAKLHVRIVTLSTKNNVNLTKQLTDGFKRFVYWNNYGTIPAKIMNNIYELLSAPFQVVKGLFVLAYDATGGENDEAGIKEIRKYFLPRGNIENYNVLIDGRNFYDQQINDLIKQHDEVIKVNRTRR